MFIIGGFPLLMDLLKRGVTAHVDWKKKQLLPGLIYNLKGMKLITEIKGHKKNVNRWIWLQKSLFSRGRLQVMLTWCVLFQLCKADWTKTRDALPSQHGRIHASQSVTDCLTNRPTKHLTIIAGYRDTRLQLKIEGICDLASSGDLSSRSYSQAMWICDNHHSFKTFLWPPQYFKSSQ